MAKGSVCKIPDCGKAHYAHGWCNSHYRRWKAHGDPLGGGTPRGEPLRWLNEVALMNEDREACLKWPYGTISDGYGRVWLDGRTQLVTRVICEHRHGPPPTPKHEAAHACGKGHEGCVNPWHLDWKTSSENSADQLLHGTHIRGERQGSSKLTVSKVREIRRLATTGMAQRKIAKEFGVCQTNIGMIIRRERWAWLDEPTMSRV